MHKDTLVTAIAGCVFIVGLTLLFFAWNYQSQPDEASFLPSNLPIADSLPVDPNFKPASNSNQPFEVIAEITPENESVFTMKVQYDGRGTARFEGTQDGSATEFFITPNSRIFCDDVECYDTAPDPSDQEFSIEEFVFNPQEMRELGQGLVPLGEEPCGQSTCIIWSSPTPVDITAPRVLIDKSTQNIIEVSGKQGTDFVKMTYTYKDIKVILPLNVNKN